MDLPFVRGCDWARRATRLHAELLPLRLLPRMLVDLHAEQYMQQSRGLSSLRLSAILVKRHPQGQVQRFGQEKKTMSFTVPVPFGCEADGDGGCSIRPKSLRDGI